MGIQKEAHFTMLILYWSARAFEHMFFREVDLHLGVVFWLNSSHLSVCFIFCKRIKPNSFEIQLSFSYLLHENSKWNLSMTNTLQMCLHFKVHFYTERRNYFFTCRNFFSTFFYLKIWVCFWLQRVCPKWILIWQNFFVCRGAKTFSIIMI